MDTLLIDPVLPDGFYNTPNEARSFEDIQLWWDKPYAVKRPDGKYDVRCLDGGAWDRPTFYGIADTVEEATALANQKLEAWRQMRASPKVHIDGAKIEVCRMAQSPLEEITVLATFDSIEDANAFIEKTAQR